MSRQSPPRMTGAIAACCSGRSDRHCNVFTTWWATTGWSSPVVTVAQSGQVEVDVVDGPGTADPRCALDVGQLGVADCQCVVPSGIEVLVQVDLVQDLDDQLLEVEPRGHADPVAERAGDGSGCLLYTSPSPRDGLLSRMPS